MLDGLTDRLRGLLFPPAVESFPAPPHAFEDEEGRAITARGFRGGDLDALVEMYVDFDPAHRAQGTPPIGEEAVREWLDHVLSGPSAVAWHGDRAVGHVTFVPDGVGRHELAIFVHQNYQRARVGSRLIRVGLRHAEAEGVERVWLTVEPWKRRAQKLYSDVGFDASNPFGMVTRMSRNL
jgi:GNAT superfamily N-acetyltransferase